MLLIGIINSILTPIIWLLFIAAGLTWIFSPAQGVRLLKHALISVCAYLISINLLQQLTARFSVLTWIALSLIAYAIWNRRNAPSRSKTSPHRGAERTPVLPSAEQHE